MHIIKTNIEDVVIIEPRVFGDDRGYFFESFSEQWFRKNICDTHFVQDNESKSRYGVLRGLHFQKPPYAQSKLVRVVTGKVLDVAVDIRKGSPTFGQHVSVLLTEENKRQFFVPRGFAHGFVVLSEEAIFQYKCDNYYAPKTEGAIIFNDPDLAIDWQIDHSDILLSEKDKQHQVLKDTNCEFDFSKDSYANSRSSR
jgi:dTDP-4-dehydrorhamnose 3,5-epimerase